MNRRMRLLVLTVLLMLAVLAVSACQRDRPAAEQKDWTTPAVGVTAQRTVVGTPGSTQVAAGTPAPAGLATPSGFVTGTLSTPVVIILTPTPPPVQQVIVPTGPTFGYVVKDGDTLYSIALTYGTDLDTLRRLNNLPDDMLQIGQVLMVPGTGAAAGQTPAAQVTPAPQVIYTVDTGDTLTTIAEQFGVDWQQIAAANNIVGPGYTIFRGQRLVIPGVVPTPTVIAGQRHIVLAGETMYGIAVQYGVTLQELMQANGLTDPNYLRVGQELIIPTPAP